MINWESKQLERRIRRRMKANLESIAEHKSNIKSKTGAEIDVSLISMICHADEDIVPHMIAYYRKIGIVRFRFGLHGTFSNEFLDYIRSQKDIIAIELSAQLFSEKFKRDVLSELASPLCGQWVVVCDADEFLELPGSSIFEVVGWMESVGMNALPAFFVQRLSSGGSLVELQKEDTPEALYPLYDFNLCERLGSRPPPWKTKFPLARVTHNFSPLMGQHWPPNGTSHVHLPIRATLSHFKWRASLRESLSSPRSLDAGKSESDAYLRYLSSSNWQLPTQHAREYSRREMIERGLLIIPDSDQTNFSMKVADAINKANTAKTKKEKKVSHRALMALDRSLPDLTDKEDRAISLSNLLNKPGRICFVTFDLGGPGQKGGIATATSSILERLALLGHTVEVIYCPYSPSGNLTPLWREYWECRGVKITFMPRYRVGAAYPSQEEFSRRIAEELTDRRFDVIHFDDVTGYGSVIGELRAAGRAYQTTALVTTTHGCGLWHVTSNKEPWEASDSEQDFGVTRQLNLCDLVIHPSNYMQSWITQNKKIEGRRIVVPNALPGLVRSFRDSCSVLERRSISEIVFFGRIERRKGFRIFLDALAMLAAKMGGLPRTSLMGPLGRDVSEDALAKEFEKLSIKPKVINDFDGLEAINYLKTNDCLAVVPSLVDNLPYTVYECLENSVPMVCFNVGGIPELVHQEDRRVMVASDASELALFMQDALENGLQPARLAFDPEVAALRQLAAFSWLVGRARAGQEPIQHGAVSVVIYNEPGRGACAALRDLLDDLSAKGLITDVVDAGSPEETFHSVVRNINSAVKRAKTPNILLIHGEIVPNDEEIIHAMSSLMERGGYDAVTCDYRISGSGDVGNDDERSRILAAAGPIEYSPSRNIYGVGPALIRKTSIISAGGLSSDCEGSPWVVWEMLNTLAAHDKFIGSVPTPMVAWPRALADKLDYAGDNFLLERLTRDWCAKATIGQRNLIRRAAQTDFGDARSRSAVKYSSERVDRPSAKIEPIDEVPGSQKNCSKVSSEKKIIRSVATAVSGSKMRLRKNQNNKRIQNRKRDQSVFRYLDLLFHPGVIRTICFAFLVLMCVVNHALFSYLYDKSYFMWYVSAGPIVCLLSIVLASVYGGLDQDKGLISANPSYYLGSYLRISMLVRRGLRTIKPNKSGIRSTGIRSVIDKVLLFLSVFIVGAAYLVWIALVVPMQYFVFVPCGYIPRHIRRTDKELIAWEDKKGNVHVKKIRADRDLLPNQWSLNMRGASFKMTNVISAIVLILIGQILL